MIALAILIGQSIIEKLMMYCVMAKRANDNHTKQSVPQWRHPGPGQGWFSRFRNASYLLSFLAENKAMPYLNS